MPSMKLLLIRMWLLLFYPPYTAHMHLADADGFDGEGLQVGEGGIDWREFSQIMDELNPTAHFIPDQFSSFLTIC